MIDSETARSLGWSAMASVVMAGAVWGAAAAMSGVGEGWTGGLVRLAVLVGVGGAVYLGAAAAMRRRELGWLLERGG